MTEGGDPYAVPHFSEELRMQMEAGLATGRSGTVLPQTGRLETDLLRKLDHAVFRGFSLKPNRVGGVQERLVLQGAGEKLPFMAWSAGPRVCVPLLLGLYWLCPAAKVPRCGDTEWGVAEEAEMGLHSEAISAVLLIVLELLCRSYRVAFSGHSPHVLGAVWALKTRQAFGAKRDRVIDMFGLTRRSPPLRGIADTVLQEKYRVFYVGKFDDGERLAATDISTLGTGSGQPQGSGVGRSDGVQRRCRSDHGERFRAGRSAQRHEIQARIPPNAQERRLLGEHSIRVERRLHLR